MKKSFLLKLFIIQFLTVFLSAQAQELNSYHSTEPVGGWDSIKAKITYPELLRRAGLWSIYVVDFSFDSLGTVEECAPTKFLHFDRELNLRTIEGFETVDSSFAASLEIIIKSVKWKPVIYDSERIKGRAKVPIIFTRSGFSKWSDGIIINIPEPIVRISY